MSFNPGEQVGPYRIMEQLGQGGMATVFKAYHPSLDRYVAIKVLHQAFLEDPNFHARFQREARVVAKLEHPNIVPIHDYAEHEKRPYLVMKFIEGETLKARLQRGPISPGEIERIVEAVGAGLHYAHKQGILHRDIKPSNVILSKDGQIYLADFGLARIAQSGESTLTSDMILGTPQYISPEQALAKKELDEGTDIYSFGVMIYEMVVGCVPFSADTPFSVIHDHIYTSLPLPSSVNPNVSPAVERVLLKALAKDRPDRYPDVVSMVGAFKEAWKSQNESAIGAARPEKSTEAVTIAPSAGDSVPTAVPTKPAPMTEIQKPQRRSRLIWITTGVIILVCLFAVFVLLRGRILRMAPSIAATRTAEIIIAAPSSQPAPTVVRPTPTKLPVYPSGVLFQANFDNGQIPVGWDSQSIWRVQDNALCGSGHFFTGVTKGDGWKDYVAKFRLRLDSGSIHLNLRQTNATGGYDRYFFSIDQTGFALNKQTGGAFKNNLESLSIPFILKQWADIELVAQGNRVLMLVNGVIVIDLTDGDNPIGAGAFTLETLDSSTACVDNIVVSDLAGKPPFDMLYEQHFDSVQSLTGWRTTDAQGNPNTVWHVQDGAFCSNGHNWAVFNNMPITDFTMKYRLTLNNGSIHLNFRVSEGFRYYTWVGIGDSTATLSKDMPGKSALPLTTGRARIFPNQEYDVTFSAIGDRIQFWLNGKLVYDFIDKAPLGGGSIAFESLDDAQDACIDDLLITIPSLAQTP